MRTFAIDLFLLIIGGAGTLVGLWLVLIASKRTWP